MMEFVGIPCCRLLAFFNYFGIKRLPDHMIMKRWMKGIKDGIKINIYDEVDVAENPSAYIELSREANDIINYAISSDHLQSIARRHFKEAKEEIQSAMDNMTLSRDEERDVENSNEIRSITRAASKKIYDEVVARVPPQSKTKGSRIGERQKGGGEKRWKTEFEKHSGKRKKCNCCKKYNVGHDSRNCSLNREVNQRATKEVNISGKTTTETFEVMEGCNEMDEEL